MKENVTIYNKIKKAKLQGYQEGVDFTITNYSAVVLLCLKDKFEFDTNQLEEVAKHMNEMFNDICEGRLSITDIATALKEENNIDIVFTKKENPNGSKI